jgi:hypothetical protein
LINAIYNTAYVPIQKMQIKASTFTALKSFDDKAPPTLASAWSKDISPITCERICFDLDTTAGFLFIDPTSTIRFMAIPKQVGHDPSPPIVGNMGDDLTQISPCAITVWNEKFIALVASDDVIKFNLPKGTNCPSLTPAPVTQDDATPGYAVHAPITNPGDVLVFSTLPTILPVPYGIPLPNGNFIAKNIFDTFSDTTFPFGKVWMTAMTHIHTYNSGKPLHVHSGLFQASDVIGCPIPDGPLDFAESILATTLAPTIAILQVWDPLYKAAWDHCTKYIPQVTSTKPDPPAPTSPPAPDQELLSALVSALTKSTSTLDTPRATLTEQGKKAEAAIAELKYRLLLSVIADDGTVVHPNLNPSFLECLTASTAHGSTRSFLENLEDFIREQQTPSDDTAEKSFNPLWSYVNLDMKYDRYLATVILNADWFQGHPDTDKMGPSKMASIFAFCAPDTASIEFQLRTAAGLTDNAEHVAGEHASKRQKTTTDILLLNKQHGQGDPLSCVANTFSVLRFMLDSDSPDTQQNTTPVIIRILLAFGKLFREPQFVRWMNFYITAYPWLPHSLIMEIHCSLRPIFQLLSFQGYRRAVQDNRPIDTKVFQDPWDSASATINRLRGSIFANKLGDYSFKPTSYGSAVCPLPKHSKSEQTPATKTPVVKKPLDTNKPKDTKSLSGIVHYTRDGNAPPHCKTVLAKLPNGNLARLCFNHLIEGLYCKNTSNCPFVHINKVSDLDQANKKLFNAWVKDTPNIRFQNTHPPPCCR